ncbi:MAG: thiamine biosynthesis protein ApbE [Rhizobiales bacterium 24-66-13]|jgi:thiamine biosynthesis lipoprotein|nr:MAG: thiamine biosynthesis protein ApbE [Rhizobiales bacterium 32-66-11]OYY88658.1 MAG: thiamine biosynthesis protein ApbE [Rhizobiales bacterium 35-66-30]OYZ82154.1 MAG: thiamine biosynthesis protein ApbE [Rhizobiales bacterium 24-66-13]OZB07868.1 MAG: thiamine biosynthesis protein ApbE [Rhizobiales bacterium 39-66-18]
MADTPVTGPISRRRAIAIVAAAAGLPLLPFVDGAKAESQVVTWKGQALGAPATLILHHPDRAEAERLIRAVRAEVARLEGIFSLYRADSALCALNRSGALMAPPADMVRLIGICRDFWELSSGAFDPTMQPLWALYARHFAGANTAPGGPDPQKMQEALMRVGFDGVRFNTDRIAFARSGMALTLNGIAQGYITDRIVDRLREAGITSSLVDMGENCAIGRQSDGRPWRIGLATTEDAEKPDTILHIVDRAVATSSPSGFCFDEAGRFGHIIDPRTGATPLKYRRVTVLAPDAASADALSTAFNLMEPAAIRAILASQPKLEVDLVSASGERTAID